MENDTGGCIMVKMVGPAVYCGTLIGCAGFNVPPPIEHIIGHIRDGFSVIDQITLSIS